MPEKGARPNVHPVQERVLRALSSLSSRCSQMTIWNSIFRCGQRASCGGVEEVRRETRDASTVLIKAGYRWQGHKPGQYVRIGVE